MTWEEFKRLFETETGASLPDERLNRFYKVLYPKVVEGTKVRNKMSGEVGYVHYVHEEPFVSVKYKGMEFGCVRLREFWDRYEEVPSKLDFEARKLLKELGLVDLVRDFGEGKYGS